MEKVLISAFCPSVFTIKSLANQTEEGQAQIWAGYIPAIIFAVALGIIVSQLIKNPMPMWFSRVRLSSWS